MKNGEHLSFVPSPDRQIESNNTSPFEHLAQQAGVPWSVADFLIESSRTVLLHGPCSFDELAHLAPLPKRHIEKILHSIGAENPSYSGKKSVAARVWDELSLDPVFTQWMQSDGHIIEPSDYEKYVQHAQSLYLRFTNLPQQANPSLVDTGWKNNEPANMRRMRYHELLDSGDTYALSAVVWGARSEVSKCYPEAARAMRAGERVEFAYAPQDKLPYLHALHEQYTLAIDVLVGSNQRLARNMVLGMHAQRNYNHEDMFADAQFGLQRAAELYDASMGYEFSTFATKWIRQAVSRGFEHAAKAGKQPVQLDALTHSPKGDELLAIVEPGYGQAVDEGASHAIASMLACVYTTPLMREDSTKIIRDVLAAIQNQPDGTQMQDIYEQLAVQYRKKPTAIAALAQRFFKSVRETSDPNTVRRTIQVATS